MKKEILKFCNLINISYNQFIGKEVIKGNLYLNEIKEIPDGFNPIIQGNLSLGIKTIPNGFNPIVSKSLTLKNVTSISKRFNPVVGDSLNLHNLKSINKNFNLIIGGDLYLPVLTYIPIDFKPVVGWCLFLNNLKCIPKDFNPTIGWYLDLTSNEYLSYSLNHLYDTYNPYKKLYFDYKKLPNNYLFSWRNGKYIKANNIFVEVVNKIDNIYYVKELAKDYIFYLATDGIFFEFGDSIINAKENLNFKINKKDINYYKDFDINNKLTYNEILMCYAVITKSNKYSTDMLKNNILKEEKDYSINELINLLGSYDKKDFQKYFNLK